MARAKNKTELVESSQRQYQVLMALVEEIPEDMLTQPGVNQLWTVKDILAHLHAWHKLFLTWYEAGMAGSKPEMPAPGYTWKQTPELNEKIYQDHKDIPYAQVRDHLHGTFQQVFAVIEAHSDDELFTKKLYKWTGSTSLGCYLISATASHYLWAYDMIKKWLIKEGFKSQFDHDRPINN